MILQMDQKPAPSHVGTHQTAAGAAESQPEAELDAAALDGRRVDCVAPAVSAAAVGCRQPATQHRHAALAASYPSLSEISSKAVGLSCHIYGDWGGCKRLAEAELLLWRSCRVGGFSSSSSQPLHPVPCRGSPLCYLVLGIHFPGTAWALLCCRLTPISLPLRTQIVRDSASVLGCHRLKGTT